MKADIEKDVSDTSTKSQANQYTEEVSTFWSFQINKAKKNKGFTSQDVKDASRWQTCPLAERKEFQCREIEGFKITEEALEKVHAFIEYVKDNKVKQAEKCVIEMEAMDTVLNTSTKPDLHPIQDISDVMTYLDEGELFMMFGIFEHELRKIYNSKKKIASVKKLAKMQKCTFEESLKTYCKLTLAERQTIVRKLRKEELCFRKQERRSIPEMWI